MHLFSITETSVAELSRDALPQLSDIGENRFIWISLTRQEYTQKMGDVQHLLTQLCGSALLDLHAADLLNDQSLSHFDVTANYELLIFQRLALREPGQAGSEAAESGPNITPLVDLRTLGFAVYPQLLLSVHPEDSLVMRDDYIAKLLGPAGLDPRAKTSRLPFSAQDLMLRILNRVVDRSLNLRRELSTQLEEWLYELVNPNNKFDDWRSLLRTRQTLSQLSDICEEQYAAMQDWLDQKEESSGLDSTSKAKRQHEQLVVRVRDLMEHISRVIRQVQRLEEGVGNAVQMHFNIQSGRANDIMRALTVLTAVFLPLNLIAGIFGMNFEFIPLIHLKWGFWLTAAAMAGVAMACVVYFWSKRYIQEPS